MSFIGGLIMDSNNLQNKPVRPNAQPGQKPVRPNVQPGQRPVRPNIQNGQRPVRPNVQHVQRPVQPQVNNNVQQNIGDDFSFESQVQPEINQEQFVQNTMQMNPVQQAQQMQQEQQTYDDLINSGKYKDAYDQLTRMEEMYLANQS